MYVMGQQMRRNKENTYTWYPSHLYTRERSVYMGSWILYSAAKRGFKISRRTNVCKG
jgi:hypothetical protein